MQEKDLGRRLENVKDSLRRRAVVAGFALILGGIAPVVWGLSGAIELAREEILGDGYSTSQEIEIAEDVLDDSFRQLVLVTKSGNENEILSSLESHRKLSEEYQSLQEDLLRGKDRTLQTAGGILVGTFMIGGGIKLAEVSKKAKKETDPEVSKS